MVCPLRPLQRFAAFFRSSSSPGEVGASCCTSCSTRKLSTCLPEHSKACKPAQGQSRYSGVPLKTCKILATHNQRAGNNVPQWLDCVKWRNCISNRGGTAALVGIFADRNGKPVLPAIAFRLEGERPALAFRRRQSTCWGSSCWAASREARASAKRRRPRQAWDLICRRWTCNPGQARASVHDKAASQASTQSWNLSAAQGGCPWPCIR